VKTSEHFELAAPAPLNLVCFRLRGGDEINERLLEQVNARGSLYMTHTKLDGKLTLRMSIGQTHTEAAHVARAWELIQTTANALTAS
jgi:aromatic-L-amino-acid decarboxylase